MKIVMTGGHHTGALPVIAKISKDHPKDKIHWIGHKHSIRSDKNETLEYKEISGLDIPFYDLKAGKLYRTFDPIRLVKIPFGVIQAFFLLLKIKPDIIMSFGGYLAAPVVLAGSFLGIPSVTHEQTVVAGYANKLIGKFAKKILLTWSVSEKYFDVRKTKVVGLPLRKEIFEASTNNFKLNPELPTIYITAGKTGSHVINKVVLASMADLLGVCNIIHQCGDTSTFNDYEMLMEQYSQLFTPGVYNLRRFVMGDEIGEAFKKADLVIGRSGAHTIYELLALEKPAILIPISWVSHNEQFENASLLYKAGLARILEEKDLSAETLFESVERALGNLDSMKIVKQEIKESLVSNSADLIVDELYETSK
ncbi:UDP-N-acetylglucosamine--N-acetylmuramyl-(pentapeptide) pyrophosphoryl-undecaprenol N-acetylglucosamine transferase [candidate division WWE3 bacterium]|jgi:UDP-N-acetylglucosamine--N-acetylmuramyl-(pentapeptide) pyrophosphoryl-undecaprenol N-acetylglucosamine transferase|nr:UDP-N-acetylglucosamine--N-acetylmuramyl-(pentapeptide) pyrophosphoryl-undecaprenol N-acetylglucosamine transferase [candidate division WWE3 bacterium]MBT7349416.1 UDP-N-acetylglucosamine--N-acetylmuramyl-(pentapeptide) pyrophosphoryl-undecaprenol N-acetylglucosamine transferase [candidate division WWE3 bacterium]